MRKMRGARLFVQLVFSLSLLFARTLCAQNYYWENPERVSKSGASFPRALSNGQDAAIFWQEVDEKESSIYLTVQ